MTRDPGLLAGLLAAAIVAGLYAQGGGFQVFAVLILLAVLITPSGGMDSILLSLLKNLEKSLMEGIQVSEKVS